MKRVTRQEALCAKDLLNLLKEAVEKKRVNLLREDNISWVIHELLFRGELTSDQAEEFLDKSRKLEMHHKEFCEKNKQQYPIKSRNWELRIQLLEEIMERYNNYKSTKTKIKSINTKSILKNLLNFSI